jgi:integrase
MQPGSKLVLRIALVTGQRIGEICGAEKSEFDLDRAEWRIPAKRVKNRREHSVPLSPLAVSLYREAVALSGGSHFVFPSRSRSRSREQPLASHSIGHAFRKALGDLGLADNPATPHDLRRTVASQMAARIRREYRRPGAQPCQRDRQNNHWRRVYQAQLRCGEAPCAGRKRGRPSWNGLPRDHQLRT